MATVTVTQTGGAGGVNSTARLLAGAVMLDLPWWPDQITSSGEPPSWNEIERPGRKPLLVRQAEGLAERRVSMIVATRLKDGTNYTHVELTCEPILDKLRTIANHLQPVSLILGGRNTGKWRVTALDVTELEWTRVGEVSRAEVSMTFKAASDAAVPIGPIKKRK